MSDAAADIGSSATSEDIAHRRRSAKTEFAIYFAIVFLATLPLATLTWAASAVRRRSLQIKGPVSRAWTQASIITPMIFAA